MKFYTSKATPINEKVKYKKIPYQLKFKMDREHNDALMKLNRFEVVKRNFFSIYSSKPEYDELYLH